LLRKKNYRIGMRELFLIIMYQYHCQIDERYLSPAGKRKEWQSFSICVWDRV